MAMASVFLSLPLLRPPSKHFRSSVFHGSCVHDLLKRNMLGSKAKKRDIVIPEPDYRIPVVLLGIAGGLVYQDNLLPAATIGLLGLLLLFQVEKFGWKHATRVRFVFDEEALNGKQLYDVMVERAGPSKTSGPK
ncbi:hypothetical protein BHM03_00000248 [Ensete ventricosum]|nr:hypothetical protein BHM03_00000248 [Ensete ventricosum]